MKFKKNGEFVPSKGYLVFVNSKSEISVCKADDVVVESNELNVEPLEANSYKVDLKNLELEVDNRKINHVFWFDVSVNDELKRRKYRSRFLILKYIFSILTLGIFGCFFLSRKNKKLLRIADNWKEAQEECCELLVSKDIVDGIKEFVNEPLIPEIKKFKEKYTIFPNLEQKISELEISNKTLQTQADTSLLQQQIDLSRELQKENDSLKKTQYQLGGEKDIQDAIALIREFGSFEHILKQLRESRDDKPKSIQPTLEVQGSIEDPNLLPSSEPRYIDNPEHITTIERLKKSIRELEWKNQQLKEDMNRLGGDKGFRNAIYLKERYGDFDFIFDEMYKWQQSNNALISLKSEHSADVEKLQQELDVLRREKMQTDLLDLKSAQKLTQNFGGLSVVLENMNQLRQLTDQYGNLERKIIDLIDRDKRWEKLAGGRSLEIVEKQITSDDNTLLLPGKDNKEHRETIRKLEENIQELEREKQQLVANDEEFFTAVALRNEFDNFRALSSEISRLKQSDKALIDLEIKHSNLQKELDELKTEKIKQESQLDALDFEAAKQFKLDFGNWPDVSQKLNEFNNLIDEHGGIKEIESKLQKLKELLNSEQEIYQLNERLKRWGKLAGGFSLEHMEEQQKTNETENRTQMGRKFEDLITEDLNYISNHRTADDMDWEVQHHFLDKKSEKVDFLVKFKNRYTRSSCDVVIECKQSQIKTNLEKLSKNKDTADKKQIEKGIKQLCDYYLGKNAQIGLLVTNSDIDKLSSSGIRMITEKEIPPEYRSQNMNLLLVHSTSFKKVITIIRFINNTYEPKKELTFEDKQILYSDPDLKKIINQIGKDWSKVDEQFKKVVKKSKSVQKDQNTLFKYLNEYEKLMDNLRESLGQYIDKRNFYLEGKEETPLLEGYGDVEIKIEEDED